MTSCLGSGPRAQLPYFLEMTPFFYFSATAMWRLFEGGAYSRAVLNSDTSTHVQTRT